MEHTKAKRKGSYPSKKTEDVFLKKHVGLIHCENKLSLMQRKICNILLFNALDNINEEDIHQITLRQLCSLIGYNSHDSRLIKEAIKSLISVVMEWNLLEDSKFLNHDDYPEDMIVWNASSLLAGASIKNGLISYSYSPQMKSVLSSLDIYGRINLFVQRKFNSNYSLVLYENCVRFKNIQQTSWFKIDLFRSLMGVSADKYPSFKEFKRNVINVAVKEINSTADIYVEPQYKKAGRNIVGIKFILSENENYRPTFKKVKRANELPDVQPTQADLADRLVAEFSLSTKQMNEIIKQYSSDYIHEKMQLVMKKQHIDHKGAYLLSALVNDYKPQAMPVVSGAKKVAPDNSYLREAKQASEIQPLKNKYLAYKLENYKQFVSNQAQNIQSIIKDGYERFIKANTELARLYKKSGLSSPFVMTEFMRYIDQHHPEVVEEYLSFDDFLTSDIT